QQEIAAKVLPLLDEQSDRRFSEPNRWGTGELEETPLKPELVVEVRYDKLEKSRFRHGTKLVRFRPDKDAAQCTWREVRPPRRAATVASLKSPVSTSGSSSHATGADTVASGRPRTEYAERIVRSRAFWL